MVFADDHIYAYCASLVEGLAFPLCSFLPDIYPTWIIRRIIDLIHDNISMRVFLSRSSGMLHDMALEWECVVSDGQPHRSMLVR